MAETSLNALASTSAPSAEAPRVRFGPFVLDRPRAELVREDLVVPLRPKAFSLLSFLVAHAGRVVSKEELLEAVWPGLVVTDDSLTQCVHELRTALGEPGPMLIRTLPRRGYRFDGDVESADTAGQARLPSDASASVPAVPSTRHWLPRARLARLAAPWLLLAVISLATLAWRQANKPPAAAIPPLSIVVLPLQDQSDAQSGWFADALTADLTTELGRLASVFVISTATAATYKGEAADPREVSRALGVRYVVQGTVQRSAEQVRLVLAMVEGESGAQQWAQAFDIERSRLGASMEDIAQLVARRLNVQMYRSSGARAAVLSPSQVRADDLAMQGWGVYFRGLSRENFVAALPLFEQAVARDPRSILGWGGVAVINGIGARIGWMPDRAGAIGRVELASARLDELDSEHLFALLAKQQLTSLKGDYEANVLVTKMTIDRYPNHAPSYSGLSGGLVSLGRFDQCVELIQRAMRLSPRDPLLGAWNMNLGTCLFLRGEYEEAAAYARHAAQMSPSLPLPPLLLAASLARAGQIDEARAIVATYLLRHPDYRAADVTKLMRGEHPLYAAGRARLMGTLLELGMP